LKPIQLDEQYFIQIKLIKITEIKNILTLHAVAYFDELNVNSFGLPPGQLELPWST